MSEEELECPRSGLDDKTAPRIRTVWYGGKLYFSLVDIVAYLKVSKKPARSYWAQLKEQVQTEGFSEALTRIVKLPLKAADGFSPSASADSTIATCWEGVFRRYKGCCAEH